VSRARKAPAQPFAPHRTESNVITTVATVDTNIATARLGGKPFAPHRTVTELTHVSDLPRSVGYRAVLDCGHIKHHFASRAGLSAFLDRAKARTLTLACEDCRDGVSL
jgi:hypothetical protein